MSLANIYRRRFEVGKLGPGPCVLRNKTFNLAEARNLKNVLLHPETLPPTSIVFWDFGFGTHHDLLVKKNADKFSMLS